MINEIKLLTLLELKGLYGFNRFLYTGNQTEKKKYIALGAVWLLLIGMVVCYVGGLVYGLVTLGLSSVVPAYLTVLSVLLVLAFGIFKAGHMIFAGKGYEWLCSLPVRQSSIVVSRFLAMYMEDMALTLLIFLPGMAVYGIFVAPGVGFYLWGLLGALFLPMIPLVIATAIGFVIVGISSRMRHKNLIQTLLTLGFVVVILVVSLLGGTKAEELSLEALLEMMGNLGDLLRNMYPPAAWLGEAMIRGNVAGFGLFAGVSLIFGGTLILVVGKCYGGIMQRLMTTSAKHNYQMGMLKTSSVMGALFRREMKRYFSSSIYVTNTIVGPIMGVILSVGILVGWEEMMAEFPAGLDIQGMVPFLLAAVFIMMTTSSSSISLEGKHFWIVKSLPIPTKIILDSKILLNLSLMAPFYVVSEVLLTIALKPSIVELFWQILIPVVLMLFGVVFGIAVNLKFYRFDWEKEGEVVKQGASTLLSMCGALVALVCGGICLVVPEKNLARAGICIVVSVITFLLYRKNNQVKLQRL